MGALTQWLRQRLSRTLRPIHARLRHFGVRRLCPVCDARLDAFQPDKSGTVAEFLCPVCGSKPPHRLTALYVRSRALPIEAGDTVLHVAPEIGMGRVLRRLARRAGASYRPGDLRSTGGEHLDVTQLPFEDGSIRFVYCCHVLNALADDTRAMREFARVLSHDGAALLQVPAFYEGATTLEAPTPEERLAHFGDAAIFRCYTDADYVVRLTRAGFVVEQFRAQDQGQGAAERHGLHREVLHICRRADAAAQEGAAPADLTA